MTENILPGLIVLPGTNTIANLSKLSVTKKKVFKIDTWARG
jgi:hypothetical protein